MTVSRFTGSPAFRGAPPFRKKEALRSHRVIRSSQPTNQWCFRIRRVSFKYKLKIQNRNTGLGHVAECECISKRIKTYFRGDSIVTVNRIASELGDCISFRISLETQTNLMSHSVRSMRDTIRVYASQQSELCLFFFFEKIEFDRTSVFWLVHHFLGGDFFSFSQQLSGWTSPAHIWFVILLLFIL